MADQGKMRSEVESTLDALVSSRDISPDQAAEKISKVGTEYIQTSRAGEASAASDEAEDELSRGPPAFYSHLWDTVIERLQDAPVQEPVDGQHVTRLVDLVGKLQQTPPPAGEVSAAGDEAQGWDKLPYLGPAIRDAFNEPIDTMDFDPPTLLSPEAQPAVAGALSLEAQASSDSGSESPAVRLAKSRHQWLALQEFISRLWAKHGRDEYALYAIWAIRPALEDWPESPPAPGAPSSTFEESPAYLAFQVEAAAIWIRNTAPLMYKSTEIWGPKGKPNWPERAGAPGRGGRRWDGVDGYDSEHKRWQLWKDVLGEVVQWADRAGGNVQGWKVKDAAAGALDAMRAAERQ